MRIGATVVRVKNEFNLSHAGDIRVINAMKIYNKGLCLNLEGDKPDTFHSGNDFRLIEDVDMPCLAEKLSHVKRSINAFNGHLSTARKEQGQRMQATKNAKKAKAVFEELTKVKPTKVESENLFDLAGNLIDPWDKLEEPIDEFDGMVDWRETQN